MAIAALGKSPSIIIIGGASANGAISGSVPTGSAVAVTLTAYTPDNSDPVVTDSQGNTYTKAVGPAGSISILASYVYVALNVTGANPLTVTITGPSGSYISGAAQAFSGVATSSAVDQTGTVGDAAATTGRSVSTAGATSQADEVSVATVGPWNYATTVGTISCTGFTMIWSEPDLTATQPGAGAYRIETATGTKTAAFTWGSTASTQANAAIVTLKGAAAGTTVTPGVGALTLSGLAPTVARTANQSIAPGVGALTLSGFAPTVARTANQAVSPGVGALTLTGFAPTVSQSAGLNLTPGVAALGITGYAPSLAQTANQSLTPGVGSLTLTGYAPTISQPQGVAPGVGTLSLTGFAPTVAQSANQGVNPGAGALSLTGYAPSIGQTANQAVLPGVGALSITGFAPVVTVAAGSPALFPGAAVLAIVGYAPDVAQASPAAGGDAGGKKKRRQQVQAEVNARNLEIIKAELAQEAKADVESFQEDEYDDDEDVLMLLL